ncbi:hypothetical protein PPERSA_08976 [Pseudocohnilembus persalinus]|uniref:Uncharacterized protein n=1 Tax=Pseudocohnilembus persalinus TaxID=266149 RepID=A0A0V0R3T8_PSEPJ|nr:hypothetical protein PPERSA_08976 [Pseudocohnilembus persalinus]|eukprot:KRX08872.1 hypothetical protein PPERSA_08976 [Pseudocohnilembus persalinus]
MPGFSRNNSEKIDFNPLNVIRNQQEKKSKQYSQIYQQQQQQCQRISQACNTFQINSYFLNQELQKYRVRKPQRPSIKKNIVFLDQFNNFLEKLEEFTLYFDENKQISTKSLQEQICNFKQNPNYFSGKTLQIYDPATNIYHNLDENNNNQYFNNFLLKQLNELIFLQKVNSDIHLESQNTEENQSSETRENHPFYQQIQIFSEIESEDTDNKISLQQNASYTIDAELIKKNKLKIRSINKNDIENISTNQKIRRDKERSIQFALEKVQQWKNIKEFGYTNDNGELITGLTQEQAAKVIGMSKKTLEDYSLQIRKAQQRGFSIESHLDEKMGILRRFNRDFEKLQKLSNTQQLDLDTILLKNKELQDINPNNIKQNNNKKKITETLDIQQNENQVHNNNQILLTNKKISLENEKIDQLDLDQDGMSFEDFQMEISENKDLNLKNQQNSDKYAKKQLNISSLEDLNITKQISIENLDLSSENTDKNQIKLQNQNQKNIIAIQQNADFVDTIFSQNSQEIQKTNTDIQQQEQLIQQCDQSDNNINNNLTSSFFQYTNLNNDNCEILNTDQQPNQSENVEQNYDQNLLLKEQNENFEQVPPNFIDYTEQIEQSYQNFSLRNRNSNNDENSYYNYFDLNNNQSDSQFYFD